MNCRLFSSFSFLTRLFPINRYISILKSYLVIIPTDRSYFAINTQDRGKTSKSNLRISMSMKEEHVVTKRNVRFRSGVNDNRVFPWIPPLFVLPRHLHLVLFENTISIFSRFLRSINIRNKISQYFWWNRSNYCVI